MHANYCDPVTSPQPFVHLPAKRKNVQKLVNSEIKFTIHRRIARVLVDSTYEGKILEMVK